MTIEPKKTDTGLDTTENIPSDPVSPQINPDFNPSEQIKKTTTPDFETDRGDHEKKYGYENEYNTV